MDKYNILEMIIENGVKNPEDIALMDKNGYLTYENFIQESIKIARFFISHGVQREEKILIYMTKNLDYVVLMIGIMLSGAAYVPFDKKSPVSRIMKCVHDCKSKYIITDDDSLLSCSNSVILSYDMVKNQEIPSSIELPNINKNNLAYIIYTSGSMGHAKGVMIEHGNLMNLVKALHNSVYLDNQKKLRIGVLASFAFDSSIKQIFYALCYGHTLVVADDKVKLIGRLIIEYLNDYKIEVVDFTPSLLKMLTIDKKRKTNTTLMKLLLGGEIVTRGVVKNIYDVFTPSLQVFNMYGPSECCVDVSTFEISYQDLSREEEILPIGKPLSNISFEIDMVDESNVGELFILGDCVGRGYVNQLEEFPSRYGIRIYKSGDMAYRNQNGDYYVVGRKDNQIKLNGYRIELEEIDLFLLSLEKVDFSISVLSKLRENNKIYTFVKATNKIEKYFKQKIKDSLPSYMIPEHIIFIENIKLTINGKADKAYYENIVETMEL